MLMVEEWEYVYKAIASHAKGHQGTLKSKKMRLAKYDATIQHYTQCRPHATCICTANERWMRGVQSCPAIALSSGITADVASFGLVSGSDGWNNNLCNYLQTTSNTSDARHTTVGPILRSSVKLCDKHPRPDGGATGILPCTIVTRNPTGCQQINTDEPTLHAQNQGVCGPLSTKIKGPSRRLPSLQGTRSSMTA
jgi:hypothetical protein